MSRSQRIDCVRTDRHHPTCLPGAFTIVELLVVITILVVLLALLVPAMDRAVYQAELAVCGSNLKAIAGGANLYASAHRRAYPKRLLDGGQLTAVILNYGVNLDVRKALRDYMSLDSFLDPLCGGVDLDLERENPDPSTPVAPGSTIVFANYVYYAGWSFNGFRGMKRLGDRFEGWIDPDSVETHRYNIIAGDRDGWQTNTVTASHPDDKGMTSLEIRQNAPNPWTPVPAGMGTYTLSYWINPAGPQRGDLDLNFAFDDGSVSRFNKVEMKSVERMGRVPVYNDNAQRQDPRWFQLPLR